MSMELLIKMPCLHSDDVMGNDGAKIPLDSFKWFLT